ncbi:hypothetical protein NIES4071_16490 [Calothrix sp. NIES-4071]|nr:hypothetical protein NIES4071_16490 [Calothrix sp. NIES-4071]BAZ55983.1 hypothetical protein NIES4105_16440 [Calothrix sp. NIES-4105]
MEQEEVINPGMAIWITEYNMYKPSPIVWKADGIAIDAYHGFGDNETRFFDGEAVLLSLENKIIQRLSTSITHFSREGFKWLIKGTERLPQTPFLITSDPTMQIIFNGIVEIKDDQKVIDFSEPDACIYPVGARDWFAVMAVKGNNRAYLTAFSPHKNLKVLDNDEIWSFDWDCPVSRIKIAQNALIK